MNFFPGTLEPAADGHFTFCSSAFSVPVVAGRFNGLAAGTPVVAGLRPEDIVPEGHGTPPARELGVDGVVILSEMLGNESLILVRLGSRSHRQHAAASRGRTDEGCRYRQYRPASPLRRLTGSSLRARPGDR